MATTIITPPEGIALSRPSLIAGKVKYGHSVHDGHTHYTLAPDPLQKFVDDTLLGSKHPAEERPPVYSDDQLLATAAPYRNRAKERGVDISNISSRASNRKNHRLDDEKNLVWCAIQNDSVYQLVEAHKKLPEDEPRFLFVATLPQSPGNSPQSIRNCIKELTRCVEKGAVGVEINPDVDANGSYALSLTDERMYELYEAICELARADKPIGIMIHPSGTSKKGATLFDTTGGVYLAADSIAVAQYLKFRELFERFPELRIVIPHGGGAGGLHLERYEGLLQDLEKPSLLEVMGKNLFFDTCVYSQKGISFLVDMVGPDALVFASETFGALRDKAIDPKTRRLRDDTKFYLEGARWVVETKDGDYVGYVDMDKLRKIFHDTPLKVWPRAAEKIKKIDARLMKLVA